MIENSQGDHPGKQDADWAHLLENKGDAENKKFNDQGHGLALFHEVVNFFKEINQHIDGDKACHQHENIFDKLLKDIAIQKVHCSVVHTVSF